MSAKEDLQNRKQQMKIIQRQIVRGCDIEVLLELAEQLRLFDAVDAQVGLQVRVQLHDFRRIPGLLNDEVNQKGLQLRAVVAVDRGLNGGLDRR